MKIQNIKNFLVFDFIFIAASVFLFHLFFWNKYVGITDGWANVLSEFLKQGKIPYRDFYFYSQPVSLFISYSLTHFFGNTLLVLRAWGIFERIIMAILLYLIFKKISSRSIALLAGLVSLMFYTGTTLDVIYEYVQTCLLFILFSTYLISNYVDGVEKNNAISTVNILAAGFFCGLAFLTKQTTGLFPSLAAGFFLLLFDWKNERSLRSIFNFSFGFLLPNAIAFFILYQFGALSDYLNQNFASAVASKGGLQSILFGAVVRNYHAFLNAFPLSLILIFIVLLNKSENFFRITKENPNLLWTISVIFFSLIIGFYATHFYNPEMTFRIYFFNKDDFFIFFIIDTVLVFTLYFFISSLFSKNTNWQWFLLFLVSLSIIYAQGFSYTYTVYSLNIACGLVLILLFSLKTIFHKLKNIFLYAVCVLMISMTIIEHYYWPYEWWGWLSPSVRSSTSEVELPVLRGLKMPAYTAQVFSEITRFIDTNTTPQDTIFVYPHMPIFYLLSQRYPSTWALVDYFDVCSDQCARIDAERIIKNPPKVFVVETFPEDVWKQHETLFRKGKISGQREIIKAINDLIKRDSYINLRNFPTGLYGYTIQIWLRPLGRN